MIGVDIGVPVPARRLQQDPAAQTRSMAVLVVAVVAIAAILFLAFMISRLGGGDDNLDPTNPTSAVEGGGDTETDDSETTVATPPPTLGGNGLVPDVEGDSEDAARAAIQAAGLVPNVIYEPTDSVGPGIVLTQSPGPGVQRSPGDPMTIVVSEVP
jgi:cytoskeleton protein RodZ